MKENKDGFFNGFRMSRRVHDVIQEGVINEGSYNTKLWMG